jgi:hypothetical protein
MMSEALTDAVNTALASGVVRETQNVLRAGQKDDATRRMLADAAIFGDRLDSGQASEAFAALFAKRKSDVSKF